MAGRTIEERLNKLTSDFLVEFLSLTYYDGKPHGTWHAEARFRKSDDSEDSLENWVVSGDPMRNTHSQHSALDVIEFYLEEEKKKRSQKFLDSIKFDKK